MKELPNLITLINSIKSEICYSYINKIVANRINMSKLIIENNYYAKIDYKE